MVWSSELAVVAGDDLDQDFAADLGEPPRQAERSLATCVGFHLGRVVSMAEGQHLDAVSNT